MLLLVLAYIGGLFISVVMLSVLLVTGIWPLFLKFYGGSPEHLTAGKKRNALIIGGYPPAGHFVEEALRETGTKLHVAGFIVKNIDKIVPEKGKVLGTIDQLEDIISLYAIKEVIIAEDEENLNFIFDAVERAKKAGAKVKVSSKKLEIIERKVKLRKYLGGRFVDLSQNPDDRLTGMLKRIIDVIASSAALIVLSPLLLVVAVLVKVTSPGNILFRQFRIGRNGKQFKMYKFRTMYSLPSEDERRKEMMLEFMKNNKSQGEDKKIIDASRVTSLGRVLRKTSIDELPQLINVLKGEMSLVGPRPCVPYEFENYEAWQKKRIAVLPGCTGVWQVSGRSSVSFDESIILDLYYVHNMSVFLDIKLIFKTIPVLLFSKGGR